MAPLITVEELDKAQTFLDKKIGDGVCSVCGKGERTLHPNIFSFVDIPADIVEAAGGRFIAKGILGISVVAPLPGSEGARVYMDLMFTTCDNCGHVDFFNAHQLGVLVKRGT